MENEEIKERILAGLDLTFERLLHDKSREDRVLVYARDGKIIPVKAKELIK
jgi:hypothetical protein